MPKKIVIYTDGSCKNNQGAENLGGWAFSVYESDTEIMTSSGGVANTSNNKMEVMAVIEALRYCQQYHEDEVIVHTDSEYVKNGITSWINCWKNNGWRKSDGKPVKNQDLWRQLDHEKSKFKDLQFRWVRGHSIDSRNNQVDMAACRAALNAKGR